MIMMDAQNKNWAVDTVMYQIFPDRFYNGDLSNDPPNLEFWGNQPTTDNFFGGDLKGIQAKLDYLVDLGIDCIYLNPIFKAATNHRYDTVDYYQIDAALGSNAEFREFIEALHDRGIKLILDGVFNHCSNQNSAFLDVVNRERNSKFLDWFTINSHPIIEKPLNYATCGGCFYLPKFNHANPQVVQYLLDVGTFWLREYGIDGWRLDTPQRVPKDFWRKFRQETRKASPDCYLVGEFWRESSHWVREGIFDGCTNYPLRELIIAFFSERSLDAEDFSYEIDSLLSRLGSAGYAMMNLLGCHDTPRIRTIFGAEDQNLLLAIVFQMTFVGIPLVYYGDEIGMTGGRDPDCRRTMEWDDSKWNKQIHSLYKNLIGIRKQHQSLRRGSYQPLAAFDSFFAFKRHLGNEEIIVLFNPGPAVIDIRIPVQSDNSEWISLLSPEIRYQTEDGYLILDQFKKNDWLILMGKS